MTARRAQVEGILVDTDAYPLKLGRYVVLNPVRAGMVETPEQWPWTSYRAIIGATPVPEWLAPDGLLTQFARGREKALRRYKISCLQG